MRWRHCAGQCSTTARDSFVPCRLAVRVSNRAMLHNSAGLLFQPCMLTSWYPAPAPCPINPPLVSLNWARALARRDFGRHNLSSFPLFGAASRLQVIRDLLTSSSAFYRVAARGKSQSLPGIVTASRLRLQAGSRVTKDCFAQFSILSFLPTILCRGSPARHGQLHGQSIPRWESGQGRCAPRHADSKQQLHHPRQHTTRQPQQENGTPRRQ